MPDATLVSEKLGQAHRVMESLDIDCWLTFCRETTEIAEPVVPFVLGADVVWATAVVLTPEGDSHVILGRHDAPPVEEMGLHEVHPYDESIGPPLLEVLNSIDPDEIAVNFDTTDVTADGLTHGMYRKLSEILAGTTHEGSLVSAADVIGRVRGEKTETERRRIQRAAETSADLIEGMATAWRPSWSEADIAGWLHQRVTDRGLDTAWAWEYCPTVHAGGAASVGHTLPGDRTVPPGELLHVDFGVQQDGYAADLQRVFYHPVDKDDQPPSGLADTFADVGAAIMAARSTLEAGRLGHEIDAVARDTLTDRGHDPFHHALGHQVGRSAHDGGTLLGPEWDRYGDRVRQSVRTNEIYTLELGVDTEWGYVGQEEMVRVTDTGTEWIVPPQTAIRRLDPQDRP